MSLYGMDSGTNQFDYLKSSYFKAYMTGWGQWIYKIKALISENILLEKNLFYKIM